MVDLKLGEVCLCQERALARMHETGDIASTPVVVAGQEFDIRVRGWRLHGQRFGPSSAPLVMGLPGLSGNIKNFDYLGERVAGEVQLVAVDWRGRGLSEHTPAGTYGWENHALDVLAIADALGFETFTAIGQSMGGSVAMKIAELDASRLQAVVLIDVAGRVDPGIGAAVAASIDRLGASSESVEAYLELVRSQGMVDPWSPYWDEAYRYELEISDGGVRGRTSLDAVMEDRTYTRTQDPYRRWRFLTMPTLLIRATRELRPGSGHVVPVDDRDAFLRQVPHAEVVEIDANHLTVNTHADTVAAIRSYLAARSR